MQFAQHVLPLFKAKCFGCHGSDADDLRGELNMLTRDGLMAGGESGQPAIVVGNAEQSPLYLAVRRDHAEWPAMPPKENDALEATEVEVLRQWIADGAVWLDEERNAELLALDSDDGAADEGIRVAGLGGLSGEWANRRYDPADLWCYRNIDKARLEALTLGETQPIDALIQRKAHQLGVQLASLADRLTLIRRATFDLLGLPPTPEQIDEFLNDPASDADAFARLVDSLLESPHYGEQMARHWLDVVRYADSSGFANDYERGNAWRFRDYVIRAFNDDKPYTKLIREQLAGDEIWELEESRLTSASTGRQSELLIAVGFLRMGPWELTGMEVPKVARQRFLDDITDAVGQVFLGQMLQCARCHDHKFDPVPTRDYYSIQAAFATTQIAERAAPFMDVENRTGFLEDRRYAAERRKYYEQILAELDRKSIDAARTWLSRQGLDAAAFEEALTESGDAPSQFQAARQSLLKRGVPETEVPPRHVGFEPQDFGMERVARKGLERLAWRAERTEPVALSVYSGLTPTLRAVYRPLRVPKDRLSAGSLEVTSVLAGGDPFSPTETVRPGILSVVPALAGLTNARLDLLTDPGQTRDSQADPWVVGRRLHLADWIASADNPLTARVMVNRLWQWHFGQALAGNPNNFGATGKKPTHPELLDWLAVQFVESGWSVKAMHRLIMNSATYRRSTQHPDPEQLMQRDEQQVSYARFLPRRLSAEELRDAMLAVSGELNSVLGGIPIRPEMNLEAALQPRMVMGTFAEAWQPSPLPAQRHRRTIYALRIRGQRDPFLEVFNSPPSDISCEAREASTVTPQVFALLNARTVYQRALALAKRLVDEELMPEATIKRAMWLVYGRPATPSEIQACTEHWSQMRDRHQSLTLTPIDFPQEVEREAVEENTGEKFVFREPLEAYRDFIADLQPSDVTANVRGLAEVCLVLINSNEFVYVD